MSALLVPSACKLNRFLRIRKSRCLQPNVKIYTKQSLIEKLKAIAKQGGIPNARHGNVGGIGNTLEDLLEIKENNLPIPTASEWELKTQPTNTTCLTTLFHSEPSPRAIRLVPQVLLPKYGWSPQEAGQRDQRGEMR